MELSHHLFHYLHCASPTVTHGQMSSVKCDGNLAELLQLTIFFHVCDSYSD